MLFAPKAPSTPPGDLTPVENAEPVRLSPFQTSVPELSDAQSIADLKTPELPSAEIDSSAESDIVPDSPEPALPSCEGRAQQQLSPRGDWPPRATPQFQGMVQLSDPNPSPTAATASSGGNAGTAPPKPPESTTAQRPPAGEKSAPLPRVIMMVGLDDAEKIVHEEMRVFSQELATIGRQIAREEVDTMMFEFRAQLNALLRW
jgi:hypothetical protein